MSRRNVPFYVQTLRKSLLIFIVSKRRKWLILDQKSARFPCENANLPHCTYFTHIRGAFGGFSGSTWRLADPLWALGCIPAFRRWAYVPQSLLHTMFLRPPQNTKPLWAPKYTPKYTPNPLPKPKYRKNTKKLRKPPILVHFSYFFRMLVSGGGSGCILGVFWRFVFCRGRTNSQPCSTEWGKLGADLSGLAHTGFHGADVVIRRCAWTV